jgi:hypothetical protein
MYSQKYIFQIALKCERQKKPFFLNKKNNKNLVGPVFQTRGGGTITYIFYVALAL